MVVLAQVLGFLAFVVEVRADYTTAASTTTLPTAGQSYTSSILNLNAGHAEFDANFTYHTVAGTWGIAGDHLEPSPTTTLGFSITVAPLETKFTPPSRCASEYIIYGGAQVLTILFVGCTSSCYPPGYLSVSYYSPGICPNGYTIRELSVLSVLNSPSTETQAFCCPTHGPLYSDTPTSITGTDELIFFATPVSIRWQTTDQAVMKWLTTATASANSRSNHTRTASLSPGALAGSIIGGLALLGLIIAGAIVFCVRYRGRPVPSGDPELKHASPTPNPNHGVQGTYSDQPFIEYELDAQQPARELAAQQQEGTPMLTTGYSHHVLDSRSYSSLARDTLEVEGERSRDAPN
ncbi:hypothetical protein EJ06DRAFT_522800 [Trichodelitschia bisporula]|uniref:Mid2 domain-containing protein n=1 Tax=Trichodelitschia bisporula TaxID=703511 RepID=A0A6G1HTB7_9PEZI|nr:hypothetical protein EJ06DRAFT_522800 [Trichodelitschia bisporula]